MSNSIKTKQIFKYTLGSRIPNDIMIIIMIIITMDLPVCKKICPNNATQFRHWDIFVYHCRKSIAHHAWMLNLKKAVSSVISCYFAILSATVILQAPVYTRPEWNSWHFANMLKCVFLWKLVFCSIFILSSEHKLLHINGLVQERRNAFLALTHRYNLCE